MWDPYQQVEMGWWCEGCESVHINVHEEQVRAYNTENIDSINDEWAREPNVVLGYFCQELCFVEDLNGYPPEYDWFIVYECDNCESWDVEDDARCCCNGDVTQIGNQGVGEYRFTVKPDGWVEPPTLTEALQTVATAIQTAAGEMFVRTTNATTITTGITPTFDTYTFSIAGQTYTIPISPGQQIQLNIDGEVINVVDASNNRLITKIGLKKPIITAEPVISLSDALEKELDEVTTKKSALQKFHEQNQ